MVERYDDDKFVYTIMNINDYRPEWVFEVLNTNTIEYYFNTNIYSGQQWFTQAEKYLLETKIVEDIGVLCKNGTKYIQLSVAKQLSWNENSRRYYMG